jgi:hypothetical protein
VGGGLRWGAAPDPAKGLCPLESLLGVNRKDSIVGNSHRASPASSQPPHEGFKGSSIPCLRQRLGTLGDSLYAPRHAFSAPWVSVGDCTQSLALRFASLAAINRALCAGGRAVATADAYSQSAFLSTAIACSANRLPPSPSVM